MTPELEAKLNALGGSTPEFPSVPVRISPELLRAMAEDYPGVLDGLPPTRLRLVDIDGPDAEGFYTPWLRLESLGRSPSQRKPTR